MKVTLFILLFSVYVGYGLPAHKSHDFQPDELYLDLDHMDPQDGDNVEVSEAPIQHGEGVAVSISLNGKKDIFTGEKLKVTKEQTPTEGVDSVDIDDCVKTVFNKQGHMAQLMDGCKHFSGGVLETKDGQVFDMDLQSGPKMGDKTGTLKKTQKLDIHENLKEKQPKMNEDFQQWLKDNKGKSVDLREASTGKHTVQAGILGDYSFYEKLGKDKTRIKEYLSIMTGILAAGVGKLPNTKMEIVTTSYYTTNPSWMANANVNDDSYVNLMNQHAAAAAGVDPNEVDVWVHITARDFLPAEGAIGWASEIGDACSGVAGAISEMGAGASEGIAFGTKEDAWAVADIATHEMGHNLGFIHDFESDGTRDPKLCENPSYEMGYQSLDWLKTHLDEGKKVWSACTLSNWANFLKYRQATGKYCLGESNGGGAANVGPASATQAPAGKGECGNCGEVQSTGYAGCTIPAVKTCVCGLDNYCCNSQWDSFCVNAAVSKCNLNSACKSGGSNGAADPTKAPITTVAPAATGQCGNCGKIRTVYGDAGCTIPAVKTCVCGLDNFCCNTQWDSYCVNAAVSKCNLSSSCKS